MLCDRNSSPMIPPLSPCSLPGLLESVLLQSPPRGTGLQIYIQLSNAIWLFTAVCVAYGIGASLAGRVAQLPFVSSAAEAQVR